MSEPTSPFPVTIETDQPHEVWIIQPSRRRLWLHVVLLLATFVTTMAVGSRIQSNFEHQKPTFWLSDDSPPLFPLSAFANPSELLPGLPFSLTLMFILMAHEMGHYLYARHYRVYATLPYFVPFPSLIGTLGAFIRIKSPIPSRAALFDIGIAGPIAGFIPACIAMVVGLARSQPGIVSDAPRAQLGFPLLFNLAARVLHIPGSATTISLHPIAVAAWVGLFATALNLLPGGQLDGGHILFSVWPRQHRVVSMLTVLTLALLGYYFWSGWLLWAVILAITSRHPAVPPNPAVRGRRRWVAWFGVLMLILTFTREPLTSYPPRDNWADFREEARQDLQWLKYEVRHLLHRK
ncbi:MAG TPA: site-2 protease family protein [Terriglobales bacterium]|jgi:Zn-dependent protease|nr:site-2 protease family protein [Terriglobales bacterium]